MEDLPTPALPTITTFLRYSLQQLHHIHSVLNTPELVQALREIKM